MSCTARRWAFAVVATGVVFTHLRDEEQQLTELIQSIADLRLDHARQTAVTLIDSVREPSRRVALEDLAAMLGTRIDAGRLDRLASARAIGDLEAIDACLREIPRTSPIAMWMRVERHLALQPRGLGREAMRMALHAIDTWKTWIAMHGPECGSDLDTVLETSKNVSQSIGRRAVTVVDARGLHRMARTWETQLRAGIEPFPPALYDHRSLERKIERLESDVERIERRIAVVDARIARLAAQMPHMTNPERRDARSNLAQIRRDTERLERERERERNALTEAKRELRRWRKLAP
ncbi:MAG: hypothetical protein H6832_12680 [Planctomycetes bacterium]|nr:hypothetical protein [Planctomycetota bacterium]